MKHRMTNEEWTNYLDGLASAGEQTRIEAHLSACPECHDFVARSRAVERLMKSSAARLRIAHDLRPAQITAAQRRTMMRINDGSCVSVRIGALHLLLAPMCGVRTSTRAIRAAALSVSASSPRLLTEKLWPGFLNQLHLIVTSLCGEPAAQLIRQRGMSLDQGAI